MQRWENSNSGNRKSLNSKCSLCNRYNLNRPRVTLKSKSLAAAVSKSPSSNNSHRWFKGCYLDRHNEFRLRNINRSHIKWNNHSLVCLLCLVIASKLQCHHRNSSLNKNVDHQLKLWLMIISSLQYTSPMSNFSPRTRMPKWEISLRDSPSSLSWTKEWLMNKK